MSPIRCIAAIACVLISSGCDSKINLATQKTSAPTASKGPNADKVIGLSFSSPEKCWAAMLEAKRNEDRFGMLQCLANNDRFALLGSLAYETERLVVFHTAVQQKAVNLLNAHGLEGVDIMGALQIADSPGGKGAGNVIAEFGRMIIDPLTFSKTASDLLASVPSPTKQPTPQIPDMKIANVKISGNRATAEITIAGSLESEKLAFVLEDGSWRISNDPI